MTKIWASPGLPLWYVIDVFEDKMDQIFGNHSGLNNVMVDNLSFIDEEGNTYPMSKEYFREKMACGTLWNLLIEARSKKAYGVAMSLTFTT